MYRTWLKVEGCRHPIFYLPAVLASPVDHWQRRAVLLDVEWLFSMSDVQAKIIGSAGSWGSAYGALSSDTVQDELIPHLLDEGNDKG